MIRFEQVVPLPDTTRPTVSPLRDNPTTTPRMAGDTLLVSQRTTTVAENQSASDVAELDRASELAELDAESQKVRADLTSASTRLAAGKGTRAEVDGLEAQLEMLNRKSIALRGENAISLATASSTLSPS